MIITVPDAPLTIGENVLVQKFGSSIYFGRASIVDIRYTYSQSTKSTTIEYIISNPDDSLSGYHIVELGDITHHEVNGEMVKIDRLDCDD